MGYETRYTLSYKLRRESRAPMQSVLGEPDPDFQQWLASHSDDLDGFIPFEEPCKWHQHERDMRALSKEFPAYSFCLEGWGDDREDIWKKWFYRGDMHSAKAEIRIQGPTKSFFNERD